jgi:hypothetical protein
MPKKITGFSLDENVVEGIKKLATQDERTLSNYVNIILAKHLKQEGYKPPAKKRKKLRRRRS